MCLEEYMTDYGKLTELSDIIADKKKSSLPAPMKNGPS